MAENPGVFRIREQLAGLVRAPVRFPLTLACAVGWAGVTIVQEHRTYWFDYQQVQEYQVYLLLGLFASLSAALFAEARGWPAWARHLLSAGAAAAVVLIAWLGWTGRNPYSSPAFLFMGPGLVLLMIVAPYLRRDAENHLIWNFNYCSWTSAVFGLLVALVVAIGGVAVLGALEVLFGLDIPGKWYFDVWIVSMSVIWPWQTLAGVPGGFEEAERDYSPRWFEYLISWLLMPLALLYLALLYAFAVKITVQWSLPQGQVGWLVGGFAGFGLAVWHAAHPLRETGNRMVRAYFKYFHAALVVPVLLLAVGTGARVAEYGITEKRYGLIVLTCWLAGTAAYGIWRRTPRLNVAPVSFAVLLILAAFGPWGAKSVSVTSQLGHLESLLAEAGILIEGRIVPDEGVAGPREVSRISNIVDYMRRTGKLEHLNTWLADAGATPTGDEDNEALLAHMGLEYVDRWREAGSFSYSVGEYETIGVAGFEVAHQMTFNAANIDIVTAGEAGRRYEARFDGQLLYVTVAGRPQPRLVFNLDQLAETLRPMEIEWGDPAGRAAMTLDAADGGLHARLHVETLSGRRTPAGNEIDYGSGVLLVGRVE